MLATLAFTALLFVMALAAVNFQRQHQFQLRHLEARARADEAARGGMEVTLSKLCQHGEAALGEPGCDGSELVEISQVPPESLPSGVLHLRSCAQVAGTSVQEDALVQVPAELLANDFSSTAGEWSPLGVVLLGYYVLDARLSDRYSLAGDPDWNNYQAEFEALLSEGTGLGFLVRASRTDSGLQGYRLRVYPALDGSRYRLTRLKDGRETFLVETRGSPLEGLDLQRRYRIKVQHELLEIEVDGRQVLSFRDPDPISRGAIGLDPSLGTVMMLDSVRVWRDFEILARWRS